MTKKLFKLNDGEDFWMIATSANEAEAIGRKSYDIDPDEEGIETTEITDLDKVFRVAFADGYHCEPVPNPVHDHESKPGLSVCDATVREWIEFHNVGDVIASSVY